MSIERTFLSWKQPILPQVAEFLAERWLIDQATIDLSSVTVLLPSNRGLRRLTELLVDFAESRGLVLIPPQILTVGQLPELVVKKSAPFASLTTRRLAWLEVFQNASEDELKALLPQTPEKSNSGIWTSLSENCDSICTELSGAMVRPSEVAQKLSVLSTFLEEERWQVISMLHERYLEKIVALGLEDPFNAYLNAVSEDACHFEGTLVLAGISDLNPLFSTVLRQIGESASVIPLVFADPASAASFDEVGGLKVEAWAHHQLDFDHTLLQICTDYRDESRSAMHFIAKLGDSFTSEEVTIGVPDTSIEPFLVEASKEVALQLHQAQGAMLITTGPGKLFQIVASVLERGRFSDLAELMRHPDIEQWLDGVLSEKNAGKPIGGALLTSLDTLHDDHLPLWSEGIESHIPQGSLLRLAYEQIASLLMPLRAENENLATWVKRSIELLIAVFGGKALSQNKREEHALLQVLDGFHSVLEEIAQSPLAVSVSMNGASALRTFVRMCSSRSTASERNTPAIELVGWLELPFDDAPVLLVTGLTEDKVPESVNEHPFLPESARRTLGLLDNERRLARDTYALRTLLESRKIIRLFASRYSLQGDPLMLSRLLLNTSDDILCKRVSHYYDAAGAPELSQLQIESSSAGALVSAFNQVPKPMPLSAPPSQARVTALKDYITCPYRYYLRHVLRLETLNDEAYELDALHFGTLGHSVVSQFGLSDARASEDPKFIYTALCDFLDTLVTKIYGKSSQPSVVIQVEQLRTRLVQFAEWQANRTRDGWAIVEVERDFSAEEGRILAAGKPFQLTGRLDRLDYQQSSGEWVVIDYKFSDKKLDPKKTHKNSEDAWIDLQLPIYLGLLKKSKLKDVPLERISAAYLSLSADQKTAALAHGDWDKEQLTSAWHCMQAVAEGIREQKFWPPAERVKNDPYAILFRGKELEFSQEGQNQ